MFAAAAAKMKGDSPADLVTALYSLKNVTLGGLIPPESFSASKQTDPDCYTQIKQESGKYQLVNGGKFACPPASS